MTKVGWGQRLKETREKAGERNKTTFPYEVGSNRTSWPNFEEELVPPPLDVLIRLKSRTGISLDWLATGEPAVETPLDLDLLRQVIQAIEEETPEIDAASKARLISRLYNDGIKAHSLGIEAQPVPKGKTASSS